MAIRFPCPQCHQRLSVATQKAELDVRCPRCRQIVRVPAATVPAASTGSHIPPPPPLPAGYEEVIPHVPIAERVDELVYAEGDGERTASASRPEQTVSVPRSLIYFQGFLLGAVALVFFVFGMIVGGRSDSATTGLPGQPCTVVGVVMYDSPTRQAVPDTDSTVIIVPLAARPDQKATATGLCPGDPPASEEHAGVAMIRSLGGDYARVDRNGRFRVRVMTPGRYYLLVVSRHATRAGNEQPQAKDLAQIGRYVVPATSLLENQRYTWQELQIRADDEFTHTF
ncbi:MAG: RING finger protein [Pirellulaceae bacterium]